MVDPRCINLLLLQTEHFLLLLHIKSTQQVKNGGFYCDAVTEKSMYLSERLAQIGGSSNMCL